MRRRAFIAGLGSAAAWPMVAARAGTLTSRLLDFSVHDPQMKAQIW